MRHKFVSAILFVGISIATHANVPPPQSMAALGDSVTSAVFADLERSQIHNVLYHLKIFARMSRFFGSFKKQAFSQLDLSWSTGFSPKLSGSSHASQIYKLNPSVLVKNFAIPSVNSAQVLKEQIPALEKWSYKNFGKKFPDYVTLFVGANDLCANSPQQMTPPQVYEQSVRSMLGQILSSPNSRVLVLPLPRFDLLAELVGQARVMGRLGLGVVSTCQNIWNMVPLCRTLTHVKDRVGKAQVYSNYQQYNASLFKLVHQARAKFGDRIRIAESLQNKRIEADDLSIDCFHPNYKMQKSVAAETWKYSWWN